MSSYPAGTSQNDARSMLTSHRRRYDVIMTSCACWVFSNFLFSSSTQQSIKGLLLINVNFGHFNIISIISKCPGDDFEHRNVFDSNHFLCTMHA